MASNSPEKVEQPVAAGVTGCLSEVAPVLDNTRLADIMATPDKTLAVPAIPSSTDTALSDDSSLIPQSSGAVSDTSHPHTPSQSPTITDSLAVHSVLSTNAEDTEYADSSLDSGNSHLRSPPSPSHAPPRCPSPSQCCGSGCNPCVFDIYQRHLAEWRRTGSYRNTDQVAVEGTVVAVAWLSRDTAVFRFRLASPVHVPPAGHMVAVEWVPLGGFAETSSAITGASVEGYGNSGENAGASEETISGASEETLSGVSAEKSSESSDKTILRDSREKVSGIHVESDRTASEKEVRRAFTPITHPDDCVRSNHCRMDLYVRVYRCGAMSGVIRQRWRRGHRAQWCGPIAGAYEPCVTYQRLVMLAAGSGMAPLLQLARSLLLDPAAGDDEKQLQLLWSLRQLQLAYPRSELLTQLAAYWNFSYTLYISDSRQQDSTRPLPVRRQQDTQPLYGEPVVWRRVNCDDIGALVTQSPLRTRYVVCGTTDYISFITESLAKAGCPPSDILTF